MKRTLLWAALAGALAGCASEAKRDGASSANACSVDADCGDEARCRQDMCVAAAFEPFNVYLHMTPAQGRAVWLTPLRVEGPIGPERGFAVPAATPVHVSVLKDGAPLDAAVRFVEIPPATGLPVREVEAQHGQDAADVSLPLAARYEVIVEPSDARWPPLRQTIEVRDGLAVEFDYDAVATSTRHFLLQGLPAGTQTTVRALDSRTGNAVSSTYSGAPVAGTVTLTFAPGDYPYALEIVPIAPTDYAPTGCNPSGIDTPSYRVELGQEAGDPQYDPSPASEEEALGMRSARFADEGMTEAIVLPPVRPRITYRGTVQLCDGVDMNLRDVGTIPINLRSTHLLPPDGPADDTLPTGTVAEPSYRASTTAAYDENAMTLQFCAEVYPGDYEVVVTAPGSIDCGIFAEQLLLKAPPGSVEKAGDALALASTAFIEGDLSSPIAEPVAGATVDASPLARADGINLAEMDRGVTQYNRPRQTTTDEWGDFSLSLDVGAYDVTVKPPAASGLSWLVVHDVLIADRSATFSSELTATVPVPIEGNLEYSSGGQEQSPAGAQLRAFTLLGDGERMRTIEIGQATADEGGHFLLLAPPSTWSGLWGDGAR